MISPAPHLSQRQQFASRIAHGLLSDLDVDAVHVGAVVADEVHSDVLRNSCFVEVMGPCCDVGSGRRGRSFLVWSYGLCRCFCAW